MTIEEKIDLLMLMQICQTDKSGVFCKKCPFAPDGRPNEPTCRSYLIAEAAKALDSNARKDLKRRKTQEVVEDILLDMGVPSCGKGYPILIEAITYIIEHPEVETEKLSTLYDVMAQKFGVRATVVERGIRAAIERGADRADPDTLEKYFGSTLSPDKGRPTNKEFIYRAVHIVRRNLRNEL